MGKLKTALIVLLVYLSIVFNLERIEWKAGIDGVGIHSFVYMLVMISLVILFFQTRVVRYPRLAYISVWALVYVFLRLTIFNDGPLWGGMATYVFVTELSILVLAIVIGYEVAKNLHQVETFIEEIFLPVNEKRVQPIKLAKEDIVTEFIRSRRFQHPLSLVVIRPDTKATESEIKKTVLDIQKQMVGKFIAASVAKLITKEVRRTDMVINQGESEPIFMVLCPETKREVAIKLAERIQTNAIDKLGVNISYGIAAFPDDALTFEDLAQNAKTQLQLNESGGLHLSSSSKKPDSANLP